MYGIWGKRRSVFSVRDGRSEAAAAAVQIARKAPYLNQHSTTALLLHQVDELRMLRLRFPNYLISFVQTSTVTMMQVQLHARQS
jgi:hypothetical protein